MKKLLSILLLCLLAISAPAQMDNRVYDLTVIGTGASSTNQASYVLRGELEAVVVTCPANAAGTITVATSDATIFALSSTAASAVYYPRIATHSITGASSTNNPVLGKVPLYGPVTVKIVGETATTTNAWRVNLIYKR